MFRMTVFAVIRRGCGDASMKTGLIFHVIHDVFMIMTLNTEFSLSVFIRGVMALVAVLFVFFMYLGHRAWHQQRCK